MSDPREKLLAQAVAGDAQAMSELLARCAPEVRQRLDGRIAAKYRRAFDDDDVLQITFLEAFLRIKAFEPNGIRSFIAWLTRIARNNLRDAVRELERQKRPPPNRQVNPGKATDSHTALFERLVRPGTTPSRPVMLAENKVRLEQAIDRLPPDYAKVVRLYDLEGCGVGAVADAMNRSIGAVYMLRSRALDCLRELLGPMSDFLSRGT
jgi:RNA polymerase sigma-70 factor (subfamily 1)